jgi:iron complex transport system ATP-binding protein
MTGSQYTIPCMTGDVRYEIRDLKFAYSRTPVLKGISAKILAGDFIGIVGPNGAGKSTFLKVLAGLIRGYTGNVEFSGTAISKMGVRQLSRLVAFVPQETHLVFPFTVSQMVLMGRAPYRSAGPAGLFDSRFDLDRAERAMQMTDTLALANKTFTQLSGGEKQRVVLASALAQDPEVLLLDEPTVYLDLRHQIHFYDIVERLNAEKKTTVISVTHDVNLAARYAHRLLAFRDGSIHADGIPDTVLTPKHLYEIFEVSAAVLKRPDGRGNYIIPTS